MLTVLLLLAAADPPPQPAPAPPPAAPSLSVIDPVSPPAPAPNSVLDLPPGRFELLQVTGYAGKARVRWRSSSPVVAAVPLRPKNQVWFAGPVPPARMTLVGGGPTVELVFGLKAGAAGPSKHTVGDDPAVLLAPAGAGEAVVEADGSDADGNIVTLLSLRVRCGAAPQPPPITPDPGQPAGGLYFFVVRPAGPASPAFTAAMSLPEWQTLRAAGHRVKDFDPDGAVRLLGAGVVPAGTQLPVVVTLRERPGGSVVVRGPVPLPTAGAGVLDLPKGVH